MSQINAVVQLLDNKCDQVQNFWEEEGVVINRIFCSQRKKTPREAFARMLCLFQWDFFDYSLNPFPRSIKLFKRDIDIAPRGPFKMLL